MTPALRRLHHDLGLHVIPMRTSGDKVPAIRWRRGAVDYVETKPTDDEVTTWARTHTAWAVLCGGPARAVCIDVEAAGMREAAITGALERLPDTCQRPTPSGGRHAWVTITEGDMPATEKLARAADQTLLAELRGHGAYAVILGLGRGQTLPGDWAPHPMTRDQFDHAVAPIIAANAWAEPPARTSKRKVGIRSLGHPMDTGEALFQAVVNDPRSILALLDDGWTESGFDYAGRLLLTRPDYAKPTEAETSANVLEGRFVCWSTSVEWATPGVAYTPAEVLARARYAGDYAAAMRAVEEETFK